MKIHPENLLIIEATTEERIEIYELCKKMVLNRTYMWCHPLVIEWTKFVESNFEKISMAGPLMKDRFLWSYINLKNTYGNIWEFPDSN